MDNRNREYDKAWAKQMVGIWMREYSVPDGALDDLADKFADAFQTVRQQSAESIGDIQVRATMQGFGRETFPGYELSVGGKQYNHIIRTQDIGVLIGLGEKYLGHGEGGRFACMAGRMLGIEDAWTK